MSLRVALMELWRDSSPALKAGHRISAIKAASAAWRFLLSHVQAVARALILPMITAGLVLYVSLKAYLSKLLMFLDTADPRVASLALASLAAGIFLSLFCYASAVAAISNLALGKEPRAGWRHFGNDRQEWRLYAAYLRFLLLLSVVIVSAYLLGAYAAPLLAVPPRMAAIGLTAAACIAVFWLIARVGFLIAPIVALTEGSVLRQAFHHSRGDLRRNSGLILLLLIPGAVVQIAGEILLRLSFDAPSPVGDLSLAEDVQSMGQMLASFLTVVSLASFAALVFMTLGAIAAYHGGSLAAADGGNGAEPNRNFPVRAGELPE